MLHTMQVWLVGCFCLRCISAAANRTHTCYLCLTNVAIVPRVDLADDRVFPWPITACSWQEEESLHAPTTSVLMQRVCRPTV